MKISQLQRIAERLDALLTRFDALQERVVINDAAEEAEADAIYPHHTSDIMTSSGINKTAPHQPFVDNVRDEKAFPHLIHGDPAL